MSNVENRENPFGGKKFLDKYVLEYNKNKLLYRNNTPEGVEAARERLEETIAKACSHPPTDGSRANENVLTQNDDPFKDFDISSVVREFYDQENF